ncbi:MAG: SUMF1/EgtB/PvdO family nonheme iron enzyme [Geminicoccaceae bacterium]
MPVSIRKTAHVLVLVASAFMLSSCALVFLHQYQHGPGVAHPVKAREVLHHDLLVLLTVEEIRIAEVVMNRRTGKRRINIEDFFDGNILPESETTPPYPADVENMQDCENCPKLVVIPAGSFDRKPILLPGISYTWSRYDSCRGFRVDEQLAEATFEFCDEEYWKRLGLEGFPRWPEFKCTKFINHGNGTRECVERKFASFPNGHRLPTEPDKIHVGSFAIGISEVTIGEFRRFVEETGWESEWACKLEIREDGVSKASMIVQWDDYISSGNLPLHPGETVREAIAKYAPRDAEPVKCVGHEAAVAYSEWLSKKTGHAYRLPSQLEWQYAARAGADTPYWWGWRMVDGRDDFAYNARLPAVQGWPSPYGTYGMYGRTKEWMADCVLDVDPKTLTTLQPYLSGDSPGFRTHSAVYAPDHLWFSLPRGDYPPSRADQWPGGYWRKDGKARTEPADCWYRAAGGKTLDGTAGWQNWYPAPVFRGPDEPKPANGFRIARELD